MRVSIGNALIQFPEVRPKLTMSDNEIKEWIAGDPTYSWVKKLSDQLLLRLLDAHFSVLDPEPFLALKFPATIPQSLPDGDVNYCAIPHSAFAEQWLNRLAELRQGGWDDSMCDLRQAYINALEPCTVLYNEAICYRTTSHDLLISYLRSWTQKRTSEQAANKQRKDQLRLSLVPHPSSPVKRPETSHKEVKALRTEIDKLQKQLQQKDHASVPAITGKTATFFCNGCGYTYTRDSRKIPCEATCVFSEHAEHNSGYKSGVPWPTDKKKLFWGTPEDYLQKHGKEMPERGRQYLELRAKFNKRKTLNTSNT